jgi:hypothetical protein
MKKSVLVLLSLLAVLPFAQVMAQTPAVPAAPTAAPALDASQFLATLADGQSQTPNELTPAPSFMAGCTSSAQCGTGRLCCNVCGAQPFSGAQSLSTTCMACVTPIKGRCPLVV